MHHPPHEKRTHTKCTKKLAAFGTLANCHGPYGRYEEEALHKAGVEANRPVCSVELSGCERYAGLKNILKIHLQLQLEAC
jgi:hypothetical protein